MTKSKFKSLSEIEIFELQELCQIPKFQKRSKIIIFRNLGFQPSDIAMQLHCHIQTVYKTIRLWIMDNFASILSRNLKQNRPEDLFWKEKILEVVQTPPRSLKLAFTTWSVKRLWYYLRQLGCPFGHERVRKTMKQANYKYRKTKRAVGSSHPDYAERKARVIQTYEDTDEHHLVLVLDQKIFLSNVGVKGKEWGLQAPTIPPYQWHNGKAIMLGVYDVKADIIYHAWTKDLKAESIRNAFRQIFKKLPKSRRITMIMDNYQGNRAKIFQNDLKRLNIKVCWLPAWSPHLSLIESKFSLVKAEAIVGMIIKSVRALKMHVTRWNKYYNTERKALYPKPKYAWR
jgi:transposase